MRDQNNALFFLKRAYSYLRKGPLELASEDRVSAALARSAAGDRSSFGDLVEEHKAMVYSLAYHSLHDSGAAEDVAQEVFLDLHRNLTSIKSAAHLKHWLRKTAVHRTIDAVRRRKFPEVGLDEAPEPAVNPPEPDPVLRERLQEMVTSLPAKPRMVVVLRYQEELELHEIAEILGMPINSVKSSLRRSLATLREKIARCLGDVPA
jgi:RNA polymerase sigma-70 factor, ECF subfamily